MRGLVLTKQGKVYGSQQQYWASRGRPIGEWRLMKGRNDRWMGKLNGDTDYQRFTTKTALREWLEGVTEGMRISQ